MALVQTLDALHSDVFRKPVSDIQHYVKRVDPVQTSAITSSNRIMTFKIPMENFMRCSETRLVFTATASGTATNLRFHNNIQNIIESVKIRQGGSIQKEFQEQGLLLHQWMLIHKSSDWQSKYGFYYGIQSSATRITNASAGKRYNVPFLLKDQLYGSHVLPLESIDAVEIEITLRPADGCLEATVAGTYAYAIASPQLHLTYLTSSNSNQSLRSMYPADYVLQYHDYELVKGPILTASGSLKLDFNKSAINGIILTCRDTTNDYLDLARHETFVATNLSTVRFSLNGNKFPQEQLDYVTDPEQMYRETLSFFGYERTDDDLQTSWFLPSTMLSANFLLAYRFLFDRTNHVGGISTMASRNANFQMEYTWSVLPANYEFIGFIVSDQVLYVSHKGAQEVREIRS